MLRTVRALVIAAGLAVAAPSWAITIDSQLLDWGLHTNHLITDWTPSPGISWAEEDSVGPGGYVGPGYGGQDYDAEAIYATYDSSWLYVAVVTGFPQGGRNSGVNHFDPGDIAIDFGKDGTWDYGIETRGANQGTLYSVTSWTPVFFHSLPYDYSIADPLEIAAGSVAAAPGAGDFSYALWSVNLGPNGGPHYVIEARVPTSAFGSDWGKDLRLHWTMGCGNDYLRTDLNDVPEPGSLLLLGAGLVGLALRRLRA